MVCLFLLYDGFTTLAIVGGYESLARIPNMQTEFVAKGVGIYAAGTRALGLYGRHSRRQRHGHPIRAGWVGRLRRATRPADSRLHPQPPGESQLPASPASKIHPPH